MDKLQWKKYWREQRLNAKKEEWKPVVGYEGLYEVSNLGRVKSLKFGKEKVRILGIDNFGYSKVSLIKFGKMETKRIHRLVSLSFLKNPENKKTVNHKNGIKTDNRVENLEWATQSENIKHAYDTGLKISKFSIKNPRYWLGKFGKDHCNSKRILQYNMNLELVIEWDSIMDASRTLLISRTAIGNACSGRSKSAGGFIWKYI